MPENDLPVQDATKFRENFCVPWYAILHKTLMVRVRVTKSGPAKDMPVRTQTGVTKGGKEHSKG
eukprot:213604-Chlamydomonas_euryale.AAC.22